MQSFFFGSSPQKMYGTICHASSPNLGALICNSWGPEAQASHRLLNVLATRLAAAGVNAMRFDYYGSGDSYGSGLDITLQSLTDSSRSAVEEIRESGQVNGLSVIGYRLGAIPALRIARDSALPAVLIDPVLDGRAWLAELRSGIFAALCKAGDIHEAGGYCASQKFIDELESTSAELADMSSQKLNLIFSTRSASDRLPKNLEPVICESEPTWLLTGGAGLAPIPAKLIDTVIKKVLDSVEP